VQIEGATAALRYDQHGVPEKSRHAFGLARHIPLTEAFFVCLNVGGLVVGRLPEDNLTFSSEDILLGDDQSFIYNLFDVIIRKADDPADECRAHTFREAKQSEDLLGWG
jgi:hypothetical protein